MMSAGPTGFGRFDAILPSQEWKGCCTCIIRSIRPIRKAGRKYNFGAESWSSKSHSYVEGHMDLWRWM
jgi:hypothetical protein